MRTRFDYALNFAFEIALAHIQSRALIISGPRAHAIETAAVSAVAGSVLRPTDNESALEYCESMLIEDEVCEFSVSCIIVSDGDTSSYQCFPLSISVSDRNAVNFHIKMDQINNRRKFVYNTKP